MKRPMRLLAAGTGILLITRASSPTENCTYRVFLLLRLRRRTLFFLHLALIFAVGKDEVGDEGGKERLMLSCGAKF
jgi:hypothetical protein